LASESLSPKSVDDTLLIFFTKWWLTPLLKLKKVWVIYDSSTSTSLLNNIVKAVITANV